jgi:hypothetical protein
MTWEPIWKWENNQRVIHKEKCSECQFQKDPFDPVGAHNCPVVYDVHGKVINIGDTLYCGSNTWGVIRGTLEKFNPKTGSFTIELCEKDKARMNRNRFAVMNKGNVMLKDDD